MSHDKASKTALQILEGTCLKHGSRGRCQLIWWKNRATDEQQEAKELEQRLARIRDEDRARQTPTLRNDEPQGRGQKEKVSTRRSANGGLRKLPEN